jgi:hypothetical protein
VVTTSCIEGDEDKEARDSDEEHVSVVEHDFKCQAWQPADHFKKLLEATCPNHAYPIWHKLKECIEMKNYMTMGTFAKGRKPEGDPVRKAASPFSKEKALMSIYGGPAPKESWSKLKLMSRAANAMSPTAPKYRCLSESPITFDWMDHPNSIPKLGRFPLIVNPLVGTTQLTNALMDRGSGLNLMYLDTFNGLGLTWDQLQSSPCPFYAVVPCKQSIPLGRVNL